jgi:signal transduction histidine kinase
MSVMLAVLRAPVARRTRREYGYVLATLVPAVPAFVLALVGLVAGVLSLVGLGLPLLAAVLAVARRSIGVFRVPAKAILGWDWPSPPRLDAGGPRRRIGAILGDRAAWRALLYCALKLPLAAATAYVGTVALLMGLMALTLPVWWFVSSDGFGALDDRSWLQTWLLAGEGAVVLLVFPWFVRALVAVDHALARRLLAPDRDRDRIADLEQSRTTIAADATATLRRIERDLHDGTQARLVSLGLMLSRLEPRVTDPHARDIVGDAKRTVTDGLDELREIIRGMHPPALDDGLPTALATLAARSPIPTGFTDRLRTRPSDAEATTLYFSATELLTNVARHAGAATVQITLADDDHETVLVVHDDGRGGARVSTTHTGLAGLRRRARALDGDLSIDSPDGGPTTITVTLPKE